MDRICRILISIIIVAPLLVITREIPASGEDIRNYSNCEICPGTIHYGPQEARKIIGAEGLGLIRKMIRLNHAKIRVDLDGVLKNCIECKNNPGYELEIELLQDVVYIRSLIDGSYIQVVLDKANAGSSQGLKGWRPEIFLQSSESNEIDLKDTVKRAWEKMRTSHIYQWIFSSRNEVYSPTAIADKILYSLRLIYRESTPDNGQK